MVPWESGICSLARCQCAAGVTQSDHGSDCTNLIVSAIKINGQLTSCDSEDSRSCWHGPTTAMHSCPEDGGQAQCMCGRWFREAPWLNGSIWHAFQSELGGYLERLATFVGNICLIWRWAWHMFGSQFTPGFRQLQRQGGLFPTCCTYSPTDAKKIVAGCSLIEVLVWIHPKFIKCSTHITHFARLLRDMTAREIVLLLVISTTVGSDGSVQLFFDKAGEEASGHPIRRFWVMCFELRNDVFIRFSILNWSNKIFTIQ